MKDREALLPGTDALTTGTVEITKYRGGYLVRYRTPMGTTFREQFDDSERADASLWAFVARLREETKASRGL